MHHEFVSLFFIARSKGNLYSKNRKKTLKLPTLTPPLKPPHSEVTVKRISQIRKFLNRVHHYYDFVACLFIMTGKYLKSNDSILKVRKEKNEN